MTQICTVALLGSKGPPLCAVASQERFWERWPDFARGGGRWERVRNDGHRTPTGRTTGGVRNIKHIPHALWPQRGRRILGNLYMFRWILCDLFELYASRWLLSVFKWALCAVSLTSVYVLGKLYVFSGQSMRFRWIICFFSVKYIRSSVKYIYIYIYMCF